MSGLPFIGVPLYWPPALLALTALAIAPGAHVLLSPLLEGRRITWRDDYAAVLIGDPLLAAAIGFAANLSRPAGPHGFPASWTGGCAWVAGGWAFGLWQSRHELSTGRYSRAQTLSPTKLWHQFIVYPVLGYWVTATEWSAYGATSAAPTTSRIVQIALVVAATGTWAILTADAMRRPKLGHGTLDRARLRMIARRLIHRQGAGADEAGRVPEWCAPPAPRSNWTERADGTPPRSARARSGRPSPQPHAMTVASPAGSAGVILRGWKLITRPGVNGGRGSASTAGRGRCHGQGPRAEARKDLGHRLALPDRPALGRHPEVPG